MTTSEFIKIKKSKKPFAFRDFIGQKESGKTALLQDFCTLLHPNCLNHATGSKCEVFVPQKTHGLSTHYIYVIYDNYIIGCKAGGIDQVMYKIV